MQRPGARPAAPGALHATSAIAGCVLGDGEAADSPRAKAQAGPTATIALHSLVEREQFGDLGRPLPPALAPLLDRYREIYQGYQPADARYLENHRGHLMFLRPEEQALCTAELIRATTFTRPARRAPRARPRARARRLLPRRGDDPPRASRDARGVGGGARGRVTARPLTAELIRRKRDGESLADGEIAALVAGIADGSVSEGQAAAFAMAVFFRGMSRAECVALTRAMTASGTTLDWRGERLGGPILDKHSTGGVGDKVSLILAPVVAACGGIVPMISGRGLAHTGGTLDKLDAIPGYRSTPDLAGFLRAGRARRAAPS